jgi:ubiquinone/menaquinone biosynthesis C-methylase UbiE
MSTATRYTHGHERAALASHGARSAANSAAYLLPYLESGMSVLDIGCGPGSITLDLAALVSPGRVVGIDNAPAALDAARNAAAARGDAITSFQNGDVTSLDFATASFDIVHAHQVLQHLRDPVAALCEMRRVCKPGGLIAARDADYAAMAWYPELPELALWRDTYRAIARANGAEPDAGRRFRAWANQAGLAEATLGVSVWHYADAASCQWWGEGQAQRCAGESFRRQAAEQGLPPFQIDQIVAGWRRWAVAPDAWFLIPHGELLARCL